MDTEKYLKLAALAAVLIISLKNPILSSVVLTGVAAWHLREFRISDMALVQKIARLTPPAIKAMVMTPTAEASVKLLPPPNATLDAAPLTSGIVDTKESRVRVSSAA